MNSTGQRGVSATLGGAEGTSDGCQTRTASCSCGSILQRLLHLPLIANVTTCNGTSAVTNTRMLHGLARQSVLTASAPHPGARRPALE